MSETDQLEDQLDQDREHLRETLSALEDKMSPGRLLDEAMRHFNTGPKAFASDLAAQVQANPMPALLTGVGLAWLMMSQGKTTVPTPTTGSPQPTVDPSGLDDYGVWDEHDRLQQAEWSCVRLDGETGEAHKARMDAARARALALNQDPEEDSSTFSSRVRSAADGIRSRSSALRDKVIKAAGSAAHTASGAASSTSNALHSGSASLRSGTGSAVQSAIQLHYENPVATAAVGVALGALFGAAFPVSSREEDVLGGVADKGLEIGSELSRKAADAVEQSLADQGAGAA